MPRCISGSAGHSDPLAAVQRSTPPHSAPQQSSPAAAVAEPLFVITIIRKPSPTSTIDGVVNTIERPSAATSIITHAVPLITMVVVLSKLIPLSVIAAYSVTLLFPEVTSDGLIAPSPALAQ